MLALLSCVVLMIGMKVDILCRLASISTSGLDAITGFCTVTASDGLLCWTTNIQPDQKACRMKLYWARVLPVPNGYLCGLD